MQLTTEELNMEIEQDWRTLRELSFQLLELSGMIRGCWIVAAERQRSKSRTLTDRAMHELADVVLREYCHLVVYGASLRNASVDFYIPKRACSIVFCPTNEAIPEAVCGLQRFVRKYPTTHGLVCPADKFGAKLPSEIHNRYLFELVRS